MFVSDSLELVVGLVVLAVAGTFAWYLRNMFRRPRPPALLRNEVAADVVTVFETALIAIGLAYLGDAALNVL